jgi:hypothetical protein
VVVDELKHAKKVKAVVRWKWKKIAEVVLIWGKRTGDASAVAGCTKFLHEEGARRQAARAVGRT